MSTRSADGPRRSVDVLLALSLADLRIRYGRGRARVLKWLLDPFAALGVYLVLVTAVLSRHGGTAGLTLACAVVPFQLVMMTVVNALRAIELRRTIIANMAFRRSLIPLASALTESAGFAAAFTLIPLFMVLDGVGPTPALLLLPVVVAVNALLAVGLAYPASLLGVWAPDLTPFAVSTVRTLFFLAPGLVALRDITGDAHALLPLNPLTGLFESYRAVVIDGAVPAFWELAVPAGFATVLLLVFVPLYRREQRHFAKVLP